MKKDRRKFLQDISLAAVGLSIYPGLQSTSTSEIFKIKPFFKISLAEWSLNRTIRRGGLINMDFPAKAKNDFGISAVEYVDQFFQDKVSDLNYLRELKQRTIDLDVENVLIMIDTAGALAERNDSDRRKSVENHIKWIDAAKFLGCHSIRVNLKGTGTPEELTRFSVDALGSLSEYGANNKIGVIVENHGGISSDAKWLVNVIKQVNNPFCGTLPDFDNWCISLDQTGTGKSCIKEYDRFQGLEEMMPYARGVSAKSRNFDEQGNEVNLDFNRLIRIVKERKTNAFKGFIGIEYSGNVLSEDDGIRATKRLLESVGQSV
jgi:hypothetical protein